MDVGDAPGRTASHTCLTTELGPNKIGDHTKCTSNNTHIDHKYTIDYNVCHLGNGRNTRYVVRKHGLTAASNTIEPSVKMPSNFIMRYWLNGEK